MMKEGATVCNNCVMLYKELAAVRKANDVLRDQNIRLAVENNNFRHQAGRRMLPVVLDHHTEWEREQEERQ